VRASLPTRTRCAYFFFPPFACERALPAALLEAALVRPSRRTEEAALADFDEVVFFGALVWDSALPAAVFERLPVAPLCSVLEALDAALDPVVFPLAMIISCRGD
jgi:hypothetical protein